MGTGRAMHVAVGAAGPCCLASEVVGKCSVAGRSRMAVNAWWMTQVVKRCAATDPDADE